MKKIIITLAFLTFGFAGFAQKTFTQATVNELFDEYKKDSKAFFINRLSDDGRYSNQQGIYLGKAAIVNGDKQNIVSTELLQPVFFQSGDLAVTSGIHHSVLTNKEGNQDTRDVAATYTWQRRNNKWMFVGSQQNAIAPSTFDEATFNGMITRWGKDPAGFVKNECDTKFIFTDGNGKSYNYQQAIDTYSNSIPNIDKKVENLKVWQSGTTGIATGKTIEGYKFKDGTSYIYTGIFTYTFSQQNGKWILASAQHTDFKEPAFTTETWKGILDEYKNDSKAFFANRLSDDFRYPLANGKYLSKNDVTAWNKENILNTEMKDPVVFQSGDLAIITGRHITVHGIEKDKAPHTDNVAVTYTFQRRNGKWMFVASEQLAVVEK
jgi:ketosteroid isomerase-like protein